MYNQKKNQKQLVALSNLPFDINLKQKTYNFSYLDLKKTNNKNLKKTYLLNLARLKFMNEWIDYKKLKAQSSTKSIETLTLNQYIYSKAKENLNQTAIKQEDFLKFLTKAHEGATYQKSKRKVIHTCVTIRVVANNIFCTLWSIKRKSRIISNTSIGRRKLKLAKRNLFFYANILIRSFLKKVYLWRAKNSFGKNSLLFFNICAPFKIRKQILSLAASKASAINIEYAKPFNGCMAKKKRRIKRLRFRRFK